MDYFEIFAPEASERFTAWYWGRGRRRRGRHYWYFGCWPLAMVLLLLVVAGFAIAISVWAAVVASIWVVQGLVTLAQAIWWPVHSLREKHGYNA
jgi:hypothetical protein